MNTSNESTESVVSEITKKLHPSNHSLSVAERGSIRPNVSLKKTLVKVRSLRLGKVIPRRDLTENIIETDKGHN